MKTKKIILTGSVLAIVAIGLYSSCTKSSTGKETPSRHKALLAGTDSILPVPLPVSGQNFNFPENPDTINKWISDPRFPNGYDSASVYGHAWGIWAGLTATTSQVLSGDPLRVFETWMGLNEVREAILNNTGCSGMIKKQGRAPLTRPKQFEHAGLLAGFVSSANFRNASATIAQPSSPAIGFWVTVSYDPNMACHSISNQVFKQSYINRYFQSGQAKGIPAFPRESMSIKPAYLVYSDTSQLLQMPVWTDAPNPPGFMSAFGGPPSFKQLVYVDVNNQQAASKTLTPVYPGTTDHDSIANATCNLSDFISFSVNQKMAAFMNAQDSIQGLNDQPNSPGRAEAGQLAILVAMHVTTKEIANWTWQTYYWTPTPTNPGSPSSKMAYNTMPQSMRGTVAGHYAANAAYVMTTPNNDPTSSAGSMFGYNPYLEGGFSPGTFPVVNTHNSTFQYGMQTNCMSCHALAIPPPTGAYTTDQFIDTTAINYFGSNVRVDFAWSIQTALIPDTAAYWQYTPNSLAGGDASKQAAKKKPGK